MVLGKSLTALNEMSSVLNKLLSTGTVVTKIRLSRIDMIPLYYFFMKHQNTMKRLTFKEMNIWNFKSKKESPIVSGFQSVSGCIVIDMGHSERNLIGILLN